MPYRSFLVRSALGSCAGVTLIYMAIILWCCKHTMCDDQSRAVTKRTSTALTWRQLRPSPQYLWTRRCFRIFFGCYTWTMALCVGLILVLSCSFTSTMIGCWVKFEALHMKTALPWSEIWCTYFIRWLVEKRLIVCAAGKKHRNIYKIEKRQLWVRPIECLKLNCASSLHHPQTEPKYVWCSKWCSTSVQRRQVVRSLEKGDARARWQDDCTVQEGLSRALCEANGLTSQSLWRCPWWYT